MKKYITSVILILVVSCSALLPAHASYNPSNLISNSVFTNTSTMSESQIQNFLQDMRSGLASKSWEGTRASKIIYDAAQKWGVNPQVILSTLQKEQSLITDPNPSSTQIGSAMGYACPDNGACNTEFRAFSKQVGDGTWQLRFNFERARGNNTWYNPSTSYACGTGDRVNNPPFYNNGLYPGNRVKFSSVGKLPDKTITIANAATASLYCYTPHVGPYSETGYSGSYNFVTSFNRWFGSTQTSAGIELLPIDGNTDTSGEQARIGIRLSQKPTGDVRLSFRVSSPSNARIVGSGEVIISPSTWKDPHKNIIAVAGINNKHFKDSSMEYWVGLSKNPSSSDQHYRNISPSNVDTLNILHTNTSAPSGVYRLKNTNGNLHEFTSSTTRRNTLTSQGWTVENSGINFCYGGEQTVLSLVNSNSGERRLALQNSNTEREALSSGFTLNKVEFPASRHGDIPVHWLYNSASSRSLYTSSQSEINNLTSGSAGFEDKGIAFYGCSATSEPVYRLYRPSNNSHFYTTSPSERNSIISDGSYRYENIAFYTNKKGDIPVYRLYRKSNDAHFYTTSKSERTRISKSTYRDEGVKFYISSSANRGVHRLYRKSNDAHFFTISDSEKNSLESQGFRYEGVKFNVN